MTMKSMALAALVAGLAVTVAGAADAQAAGAADAQAAGAPAAPAGGQPYQMGAALPGVCSVSINAVMQSSAVGKFVTSRMQTLAAEVKAEIAADQKGIETDAKTLEGQRTTLSQDQLRQKAGALQQRADALNQKAEIRQKELQDTFQGATNTALSYADPILHSLVASRSCSVLLNGDQSIIAISPGSDLSSSVVQQLDAKVTQFPFEREHLPQQGGAAPAR